MVPSVLNMIGGIMLELDDFTDDKPWVPGGPEFEELRIPVRQFSGMGLRILWAPEE